MEQVLTGAAGFTRLTYARSGLLFTTLMMTEEDQDKEAGARRTARAGSRLL